MSDHVKVNELIAQRRSQEAHGLLNGPKGYPIAGYDYSRDRKNEHNFQQSSDQFEESGSNEQDYSHISRFSEQDFDRKVPKNPSKIPKNLKIEIMKKSKK